MLVSLEVAVIRTLLVQERIANEIEHGRFLARHGAGEIWNWEGQAGKLRWARRVKMLSNHLGATLFRVFGTDQFRLDFPRIVHGVFLSI